MIVMLLILLLILTMMVVLMVSIDADGESAFLHRLQEEEED